MPEIKEITNEVSQLKSLVIELIQENTALKKRVLALENKNINTVDLRLTAKRVLGFTMSNVRGYYNAVRTINGSQIRIYIGKDISNEEKVKEKIISYITSNARWLHKDIKECKELIKIKQIKEAVSLYSVEEVETQTPKITKVETIEHTVKKIYGFNINTYNQGQQGVARQSARLTINGVKFNISLPPEWNKGIAKMRIIEYLEDKNRQNYLELYCGKFPEYAKELGLKR